MRIILQNAKIFGPDAELTEGDVTIEDGVISAVGEEVGESRDGDRIFDLHGCTVLPGLIDAHTHLTFTETAHVDPDMAVTVKGLDAAARALQSGITTVRDVGGIRGIDFAIKRALGEREALVGPDVLVAGQFISITGGHSHQRAMEADGPSGVRRAVRTQLKRGADYVKLMASGGCADPEENPEHVQMTDVELEVAFDEAERAGREVIVHAHPAAAIAKAARLGARSVEHATYLTGHALEAVLKNDTWVVPTFAVYDMISRDERWPPGLQDKARSVIEEKIPNFLEAVECGVRWAVGTDSGTYYPPDDLQGEIEFLVEIGIPPAEVIARCTQKNAELLGLSDRGAVQRGRRADLLAVRGDPLADVGALRDVQMVIQEGRPAYVRR